MRYICPRCRNYCCRCGSRRPPSSTLFLPGALITLGLGFLFFCWPALVWHGYSSGGDGWGWRWDIHSTYACLIWWAVLAALIIVAILAEANSPRIREREKE